MLRFVCLALGFALALCACGSVCAQPKVTDKQMGLWVEKVSQLKPEEQEAAFRAKMGELNLELDTDPKSMKIVTQGGAVRELTIPATYLKDVRPVVLFRDLEKLTVNPATGTAGKLDDVTCLASLTKLKELSLSYTAVEKLGPLTNLPLEKLHLGGTHVKDVQALKKMPLTEVQLPDGISVKQLEVLAGKPLTVFITKGAGPDTAKQFKAIFGNAKLETYTVARSNIEDLQPLANMPLKILALGDAPNLKSLAPLKGCATLRQFAVAKAPLVTDLKPLVGKALHRLEVPYCTGVRDLTPLAQIPGLIHLNVTGTKVTDLTPVAGLNTLQGLWASDLHEIKSLKPVANLPTLLHLELTNTTVADKDFAPLTKLPSLRILRIDETPATTPLVKKIPTLETLNGKPFVQSK